MSQHTRNWSLGFVGALMALSVGACHGSGGSGDATAACNAFADKLRSCGLMSSGVVDCGDGSARELHCFQHCANATSCADLTTAYCSEEDTPEGEAFVGCVFDCLGSSQATFSCADGSSILAEWQCDGYEDCADGSDEVGCPTFRCADGDTVHKAFQCNGREDCADGSDEAGCPTFRCADGDTVRESFQCDGYEDCADGSDEAGCPEYARIVCTEDEPPSHR